MKTKTGLQFSTPESEGVSSGKILDFINGLRKKKLQLHSFIFLRNGKIISEAWWKPYAREHRHELYSLSKSFTSTAVGIAVDMNLLGVDDKVISYFPEYAGLNKSVNLSEMRIRHLLTMSTGHAEDTAPRFAGQKDWIKIFFEVPLEHKPGTFFKYNSGATYIMAVILQKLTGQSLTSFLENRLFAPLGINDVCWDKCPKGFEMGGAGLNARTIDIAKLGQLYLNNGVWNGRRILSEKWVKEATTAQISNGSKNNSDWEQGYGYQFWRCRHNVFRGDGAFGQFCIVVPDKNAVIAITSGLKDMQGVLDLAWKHLLPAMKSYSLIPQEKIYNHLKYKLLHLDYTNRRGSGVSPAGLSLSGREYSIEKNDLGIESVSFSFEEERLVYFEKTKAGTSRVECGYGRWINTSKIFYMSYIGVLSFRTAASYRWINGCKFELTLFLFETPFCRKMLFNFVNGKILVDVKFNVGWTDKLNYKLTGSVKPSVSGIL